MLGRGAAWVGVGMVALVAVGCDDEAPRHVRDQVARGPLDAAFTISCSALASGQIGPSESVTSLAAAELSGSTDVWTSYVELSPATHIVCNYNLAGGIAAGAVTSLSLDVNYRGPSSARQLWTFEALDTTTGAWVSLGSNSFATGWVWTKHTFTFPSPLVRFFSSGGLLQIRYGTDSSADASDVDQMLVRGTTGAATMGTAGVSGTAGTGGTGGVSGTAGTTSTAGRGGVGGAAGAGGTIGRGGTTGTASTPGAGGSAPFSMACRSLASGTIGPGQSVASLATAELSGTTDAWTSYVELEPASQIVCNYDLPSGLSAGAVTSMALQVNYRGPSKTTQLWTFEVRDTVTGTWVPLGDNAFATGWVWTPHAFALPAPLTRYVSGSTLQIRYGTTSSADASNLDQMVITAIGGAASGGAGGAGAAGICGSTVAPPPRYQHVVVFSFENRTWSDVGLGFSAATMPYLHALASQCSFFSDWTETDVQLDSLPQYIGTTSGVDNPSTVASCDPSETCRSTDDNIFRQVRTAGGTTRSYVEGATTGCSDSGNAARHIPALYYYGTYTDATGIHNDHDFCDTEVRPYAELDVNNLPTFAWITPTLCNDGHDCGDSAVDSWASTNVQRVLDSAAYKAGTVAVFIWYDEDHPVPNAQIAPTSHKGNITQPGVGSHAALLKTMEDLLGLPVLNQGQIPGATNLRSLLGI